MSSVDEKRRRILDEHRREQNRRHAVLSPGERLAKAEAMRSLARLLGHRGRSRTDEPPELLRAMKAHFERI